VRNTAFAYIRTPPTPSHQHLLVGTQFGDIRRYDTRAARRPISNWTGVGKTGGIGGIENGFSEQYVSRLNLTNIFEVTLYSQVFVSDRGSNLYALDLRNGKVSCGYKGNLLLLIMQVSS
jgi:ribosome biogenesis protein NSA1